LLYTRSCVHVLTLWSVTRVFFGKAEIASHARCHERFATGESHRISAAYAVRGLLPRLRRPRPPRERPGGARPDSRRVRSGHRTGSISQQLVYARVVERLTKL
jgi:hypothetical protein